MPHKEHSVRQAYWYSLEDDPFIIYIDGYRHGIAFKKDKEFKYISYKNLKKEKWRDLGVFYGWNLESFESLLDMMEEYDGAGVNGGKTALERPRIFLEYYIREKRSLKFVDNDLSRLIIIYYAKRSLHQEKLAELEQKLDSLEIAGKNKTAVSKVAKDTISSIKSHGRQIEEENDNIKKYKKEYEEEQIKIAEEEEEREKKERKKLKEDIRTRQVADEKKRMEWKRLIPQDHPYNINVLGKGARRK